MNKDYSVINVYIAFSYYMLDCYDIAMTELEKFFFLFYFLATIKFIQKVPLLITCMLAVNSN